METSPNHLLNCFRVMFSCKTLLLNIAYVFVSAKEFKKRGFLRFLNVLLLIRVQWLPVFHEIRSFYSFSEVLEGILDENG